MDQEQWEQWRSNLEHFRQHDAQVAVEEIPSLCELELACCKVAPGKASGLDGMPSELCRFCPTAVAAHLYSMLLKACVHAQEALSHKGGYLIPIWEGKQQKDQWSAFRSGTHPPIIIPW